MPRRFKEFQPQLIKARADLSQQFGRAPNATEIAEHLGIERQSVIEAEIACNHYSTRSTDEEFGYDGQSEPFGIPGRTSIPGWTKCSTSKRCAP